MGLMGGALPSGRGVVVEELFYWDPGSINSGLALALHRVDEGQRKEEI